MYTNGLVLYLYFEYHVTYNYMSKDQLFNNICKTYSALLLLLILMQYNTDCLYVTLISMGGEF